ncbi:GNAT family N-acetyltransferase [Micromonospora sp. NBC_00389]|uniref:GNAT family N-acetyltransferase n=1 Tax=Micromonospora sp. NBC_00389 TaxID=2903586 RepID=UPI002E1FD259
MADRQAPVADRDVRIVPANEASWDDLQEILGSADAGRCQCQWFKVPGWLWRASTPEGRVASFREQTSCGEPDAPTTSGLVAYLDDHPAGWVAVEPRTAYPKLRNQRVPWLGRDEDRDDDGVWAVTCLVVRKGFRGRGLTYPLARAAVDFARERGARSLAAYPMLAEAGKQITWGEAHVGVRQIFEDAGFKEVSHPTLRRVVMRIDFADDAGPAAAVAPSGARTGMDAVRD